MTGLRPVSDTPPSLLPPPRTTDHTMADDELLLYDTMDGTDEETPTHLRLLVFAGDKICIRPTGMDTRIDSVTLNYYGGHPFGILSSSHVLGQ